MTLHSHHSPPLVCVPSSSTGGPGMICTFVDPASTGADDACVSALQWPPAKRFEPFAPSSISDTPISADGSCSRSCASCFCCRCRFRLRHRNKKNTTPSITKIPTPTPIPALAPGLKPEFVFCDVMGGDEVDGPASVSCAVMDGPGFDNSEGDLVELPNDTPITAAIEDA